MLLFCQAETSDSILATYIQNYNPLTTGGLLYCCHLIYFLNETGSNIFQFLCHSTRIREDIRTYIMQLISLRLSADPPTIQRQKVKGKVVPVLNYAPRHEHALGAEVSSTNS
jgi:hypothetical protein